MQLENMFLKSYKILLLIMSKNKELRAKALLRFLMFRLMMIINFNMFIKIKNLMLPIFLSFSKIIRYIFKTLKKNKK